MSLAPTQPTVKPVSAFDFATPYMMGVMDAEENLPFCPEEYFVWDGDMMSYLEGFEAIKGESEITRSFKAAAMKPMLTDAQIEAEHEDLVEGMNDEAFWRMGC